MFIQQMLLVLSSLAQYIFELLATQFFYSVNLSIGDISTIRILRKRIDEDGALFILFD